MKIVHRRFRRLLVPALGALALAILVATPAWSQEADVDAAGSVSATTSPGTAPLPDAAKKLTLWEWFKIGGWAMWPLLGCSVGVVFLVIRNFMILNSSKLLREDLVPQITDHIVKLDIKGVRAVCQSNSTLMTRILDSGMERVETAGLDMSSIEKAMEEASTEEVASYLLPINAVNIIAVVSPMLGLLGTVSGMIKAFFNISLGGMGKPEMLASNIGEALITTQTGLIVAIPAMAFYFYFKNDFTKTVALAGKLIGRLIDRLRMEATNQSTGTAHVES